MNATTEKELFERMVDRVLAYRPKRTKSKEKRKPLSQPNHKKK